MSIKRNYSKSFINKFENSENDPGLNVDLHQKFQKKINYLRKKMQVFPFEKLKSTLPQNTHRVGTKNLCFGEYIQLFSINDNMIKCSI